MGRRRAVRAERVEKRREHRGVARLRAAAFAFAICLMLAGPSVLLAAEKLDVSLPGWLTSEDAAYLSGGVQKTDFSKVAGVRSFLKSIHQNAEKEIGNYIPMKAMALLANAAWQRDAIALSNGLWGWDCYPTSFGADHLYIPAQKAVCKWPRTVDPASDEGLAAFADGMNGACRRYEGVRFISYLVARSEAAAPNPARAYLGATYTAADSAAFLGGVLDDGAGEVLHSEVEDLDTYYEQFFRSDHHWRALGAVSAYNQIADALGKDPLPTDVMPVEGPLYSGAYARNSLCMVTDEPSELAYDFTAIELSKGDTTEDGNEHALYASADEQNKHWRFYDLFYNSFMTVKGTGEGRALLVCDSFGFALLRPLATGFAELTCVNSLQATANTDQSLVELLRESGAGTVLFVGDPGNFSTFCERNPQFFE